MASHANQHTNHITCNRVLQVFRLCHQSNCSWQGEGAMLVVHTQIISELPVAGELSQPSLCRS
eukprot:702410-Amphidinium_carterae.1